MTTLRALCSGIYMYFLHPVKITVLIKYDRKSRLFIGQGNTPYYFAISVTCVTEDSIFLLLLLKKNYKNFAIQFHGQFCAC